MRRIQTVNRISLTIVIAFAVLTLSGQNTQAEISIVTTLPDLAAIARDIGGDKVEVVSLTKGYQDPHFVDAKPIYVTKLNNADMLIYNGLELEVGWLPVLITGARNSDILAANTVGHYNASTSIKKRLEVPTGPVDRSMGDVHPSGNPHYMLDPRNGIPVARGIAARLIKLDPENAGYYEEKFDKFVSALERRISEWEKELEPYRGTEVVTYHKVWTYFLDWAGFELVGTIEPKPGIPPSPSYVAKLVKIADSRDVSLIMSANYYPRKTAEIIAQKTGAAYLILPSMVEGQEGINTYFDLFDTIVTQITSALKDNAASESGPETPGEG